VNQSISFARTFNLDGIDIDWEFACDSAGRPQDGDNYALLLKQLHASISADASERHQQPLLISVAAPIAEYVKPFQPGSLHPYVDHISVMTYNYHGWEEETGFNSPLPDVISTMQSYLAAGVPSNKLQMGIPTYGLTWQQMQLCQAGAGSAKQGPPLECSQGDGTASVYEWQWLLAAQGVQTFWNGTLTSFIHLPFAILITMLVW
jgi:chitinase